jgi:hypothetical protein
MKFARFTLPLVALLFLAASTASASAAAKPNLKVKGVTVTPSTVVVGGSISVTATTVNAGRGKAKKSSTSFVLRARRNQESDTMDVAKKTVKPLKKGGKKMLTITELLPAKIVPGTYFVGACADSARKVKETKETDNCAFAATPITVTAIPSSGGPPGSNPPPATPANTVLPSISGDPGVGGELTANAGTWTPAGVFLLRSWLRCTDSTTLGSCTAIPGQEGATYTPVAADAGNYIRLQVTATNSAGSVTATSAATAAVAADTDADGTPDTADCAPLNSSLPGTHPEAPSCAGTIYDVNNGNSTDGASVVLSNVLVTAVAAGGKAFVQVKSGDPGFNAITGGQYSGVELSGVPGSVEVGNRVNVVGLRDDTATDRVVAADSVDVTSVAHEAIGFNTVPVASFAISLDAYDAVPVKFAEQTISAISGGEWTIGSGITVGKSLTGTLPGTALIGDSVDVSGIGSRAGSGFVLPRSSGDIFIALRLTDFTVINGSIEQGSSGVAAATVTLNHAAPTTTFVTVESDDPGALTVDNGGVTIASGQSSGNVLVTATGTGSVTLTATFGTTIFTVNVAVMPPEP